jgi:DNA-binding MarR family transcriptional regulator
MNAFPDGLHKAFEHRIRLGIMAALSVNTHQDFRTLKELLEITDGNLASHIKALVKEEFIQVEKQFLGNKPNTRYAITPAGKHAFSRHIDALETLIKLKRN